MATGFPVKANYATGDVLTAANMNDLSGTVNYLQYMPPRNAVLNSAFNVWQRGTSIAISSGTSTSYTADRWLAYRNATGGTVSRQATNDTTNLPNIQYCARVQRDSGNTSTQAIWLTNNFESLNSIPFAGKTVTLSFYARAGATFSSGASGLGVRVYTGTGTDQNIINGYTGASVPIDQISTLTTTWQRFSYSATLATNITEIGLRFVYDPVGTAGANDYFEITGVQLELGSTANTYMPNQPTYQGELAACQRYYYRVSGTAGDDYGVGYNYSTGLSSTNISFPTIMRTSPSLETSGTATDYEVVQAASVITCTQVPIKGSTSSYIASNMVVQFRASGLLTIGYASGCGAKTANGYLGFSAEL